MDSSTMAGTQSTLVQRMIRAARLEPDLYEEVEADQTATNQALIVVVIVALASGIPSVLLGRPFLTALWTSFGSEPAVFHFGTPFVFDVGVFLAVIGVVLTIVFTLAEVVLPER